MLYILQSSLWFIAGLTELLCQKHHPYLPNLPQTRVADSLMSTEQAAGEGYSAGVVDAHEDGDAAHDAGPLPLELVGLPKVAVDAGVQQANHSCKRRNTTCTSC